MNGFIKKMYNNNHFDIRLQKPQITKRSLNWNTTVVLELLQAAKYISFPDIEAIN